MLEAGQAKAAPSLGPNGNSPILILTCSRGAGCHVAGRGTVRHSCPVWDPGGKGLAPARVRATLWEGPRPGVGSGEMRPQRDSKRRAWEGLPAGSFVGTSRWWQKALIPCGAVQTQAHGLQ